MLFWNTGEVSEEVRIIILYLLRIISWHGC
jgi:hypothetical protein